jgi:ectoine hydroxylase-related dioxygenase (phytanoyl-CoA dioxygenase family)
MSERLERLTTEQRKEFEETGLLHLPAAISDEHVAAMRDRLWVELDKKYHMRRDEPETWRSGLVHGLQQPVKEGAFANMACPALIAALDELFAPEGWQKPARWGGPLVTFPSPGHRWHVPHQTWHLDVTGPLGGQWRQAEVTVFAFLAAVASHGGATVVVTGTNRLLRKLSGKTGKVRSAEGRAILSRTHTWLKDLWSKEATESGMRRFMEEGAVVDGVPLKVVEITGNPGDVVIMHPCILHTVSANCLDTPRLALRQGIYRVGVTIEEEAAMG